MTELKRRLVESVPSPPAVDVDALMARASRHRRLKRAATAAVPLVLIVAAASALWAGPLADDDPRMVLEAPDELACPETTPAEVRLPEGWESLPRFPIGQRRRHTSAAAVDEHIVVWGGRGETQEWTGEAADDDRSGGAVLSLSDQQWECVAPAPVSPPAGGAPVIVAAGDDEAIVFGEDGQAAALNPDTATWRGLAESPLATAPEAAVWTDDQIAVLAADASGAVTDVAAYDPSSDQWRDLAGPPTGWAQHRVEAAWTGEELIALGRAADTERLAAAALDLDAGTWRQLPPVNLSGQALTASWAGDELVVVDHTLTVAIYQPATDDWVDLADSPAASPRLDAGDCPPDSAAVGSTVLLWYCNQLSVYHGDVSDWTALIDADDYAASTSPQVAGFGSLVAANRAFLLVNTPVNDIDHASIRIEADPVVVDGGQGN